MQEASRSIPVSGTFFREDLVTKNISTASFPSSWRKNVCKVPRYRTLTLCNVFFEQKWRTTSTRREWSLRMKVNLKVFMSYFDNHTR